MDVLFLLWIIANVISPLIPVFCAMADYESNLGYQFVNPVVIYRHTPCNWFGVILLTIAVHALAIMPAIVYWLYKLCTVGRKD